MNVFKRFPCLAGATLRIPAIPTHAFMLAVAGGIWLCLWRTRWRLLGLVAIAAGIGLAPTLRRPDMLVGRDGHLVAVRLADRAYSAVGGRGGAFELQRWLEHDGDHRTAREAGSGAGFACDALGCTVEARGLAAAVARHPAALRDDCTRARILVLTFPRPRGCDPPGTVIDFFDLRRNGTHALYIEDGRTRVVSVADLRGDRPWTFRRPFRVPAPGEAATSLAGSRLGSFAPPYDLAAPGARPRPEIEDEDAMLAPDEDTHE